MRKFFISLLVLAALIGAGFLFFSQRITLSEKGATNLPALADLPQVFNETYSFTNDSDGDGLSDAKEIIYGTDPHNPDTDGDGFLDGKEVKAGFDPLVPGKARLEDRKDASLSVQYFSYAAKKTGNPDPALDSALIEEFLTQKGLLDITLPFVAEHDIPFTNDDPKKIIDYFSFTSKLTLPTKGAPFLALAKDVIQNQNFAPLKEVLDSLESTRETIKKTPVPSSLKDLYTGYLGVWMTLNDIFSSLKKARQDPVAVYLAQKRGAWIAQEIKKIEDRRASLLSDFRLKSLQESDNTNAR